MSIENLSGTKKAAIFLVSLGAEASSKVYQYLTEGEVERVSAWIDSADGGSSRPVPRSRVV